MSNSDKLALRKKLNRRLNDAFGFQRTSGGKHTTISLSIDECKSVLVALDALEAKDKLNAELMEKQRLIDICQGQGLEHRIAAEKRAEAAEKRIAELEESNTQVIQARDHYKRMCDEGFRRINKGINLSINGEG